MERDLEKLYSACFWNALERGDHEEVNRYFILWRLTQTRNIRKLLGL